MSDLKETLLQDLCARLPYHTMVECKTDYSHKFDEELSLIHIMNFYQFDVKPYLRPMSSMTEEEFKIYSRFSLSRHNEDCFDWLNKHHFDYRGLIEKGLALKAKKGMYE